MPSSKTPAGSAESTAAGNSGNPSTSQKTSNATAEAIRGARAPASVKSDQPVTVNQVRVSETTVAQPPAKDTSSLVDPSTANNDLQRDRYRNSDNPGSYPSRQLGEAEEDKIASISVKAYDGTEIVSGFTSFFLQSVSESEQEKYQIVETFTAYYAFFFGKRPPIYRYSGMLLNDQDHNWMNTFRVMYENYFRGTASAELGAQAIITYDKRAVSGFLLGLNIQQDAANDKGVPFSFDVLVINHDLVGFSSDFDAFVRAQQDRLRELRDRAAADIASLNKGQDTLQSIFKNSVLTGKVPAAIAKKIGDITTPKPDTQEAKAPTKLTDALVQGAIPNDPSKMTYENDLLIK